MVTYRPTMCDSCHERPATIFFDFESIDEPRGCIDCYSPCGGDCCGDEWWPWAELADAVWALDKKT